MSEHDEVVRRLCALMAEQLQRDAHTLGPATSLTHDVALDSLAQMGLIVAIENTFEVCLSVGEGEPLPETIDALATLIEQAKAQALA